MSLPNYIDFTSYRIIAYDENCKLREGDAFEVFKQSMLAYYSDISALDPNLAKFQYVNTNLFSLVSKRIADIAVGEEATIDFKDEKIQDWMESWMLRNNLHSTIYSAIETGSALGDTVFKLSVGETYPESGVYDIYCDIVNPKSWFPKTNGESPNRAPSKHSFVLTRDVPGEPSLKTIFIETHEPKKIRYSSFVQSQGIDGLEWVQISPDEFFSDIVESMELVTEGLEYTQDTGVDFPLVFHVKNSFKSDSIFGESDYEDIKSIVYNINLRLTGNQASLNDYTSPLLFVPEGTIDKVSDKLKRMTDYNAPLTDSLSGSTINPLATTIAPTEQSPSHKTKGQQVKEIIKEIKITEGSGDGLNVKPEFIQYDSKLADSFTQIDTLYKAFYAISEIAPILIDTNQNLGQLSGTALKILAQPTLKKAQRKTMFLKSVLVQMLKAVQILAKDRDDLVEAFPSVEPVDCIIKFNDGLINDDREIVSNEQAAIAAGIQSRLGAIIAREGVTKIQAEKKLEEIEDEAEVQDLDINNPELLRNQPSGEQIAASVAQPARLPF